MLFKLNKPNNLYKKQKARINKKNHFFVFFNYDYKIVSIGCYKLFLSHFKILNLILTKKIAKKRKLSKKEQFKRLSNLNILSKQNLKKDDFFRLGVKSELNEEIVYFKYKLKKIKKNVICLNLLKLPYTKKPIGARMGKGNGVIVNWYFKIFSNMLIFTFFNFSYIWISYFSFFLKKLMPGNNIFLKNYLNYSFYNYEI